MTRRLWRLRVAALDAWRAREARALRLHTPNVPWFKYGGDHGRCKNALGSSSCREATEQPARVKTALIDGTPRTQHDLKLLHQAA